MSSDLVCYTVGLNYVTSSNQYFTCGASNSSSSGAQTCCYAGDICMEDGICHYTHTGVGNGTGYYMAACTDPTWKDPACPKACTSEYGADVVWNAAENVWKCCTSHQGYLNCDEPSNFTVYAPSPSDLATVKSLATPVPSPALITHIGAISSMSSALPGNATSYFGTSATSNSTIATSSASVANLTLVSTKTASSTKSLTSSLSTRSLSESFSTQSSAAASTQASTSSSGSSATSSSASPSKSSSSSAMSAKANPKRLILSLLALLPAAILA